MCVRKLLSFVVLLFVQSYIFACVKIHVNVGISISTRTCIVLNVNSTMNKRINSIVGLASSISTNIDSDIHQWASVSISIRFSISISMSISMSIGMGNQHLIMKINFLVSIRVSIGNTRIDVNIRIASSMYHDTNACSTTHSSFDTSIHILINIRNSIR